MDSKNLTDPAIYVNTMNYLCLYFRRLYDSKIIVNEDTGFYIYLLTKH